MKGKLKKIKAPKPNIKEYQKADEIKKSFGGNIRLVKEKKKFYTDGTKVITRRYTYKRPTKQNIAFVNEVGYEVVLKKSGVKKDDTKNKKNR